MLVIVRFNLDSWRATDSSKSNRGVLVNAVMKINTPYLSPILKPYVGGFKTVKWYLPAQQLICKSPPQCSYIIQHCLCSRKAFTYIFTLNTNHLVKPAGLVILCSSKYAHSILHILLPIELQQLP